MIINNYVNIFDVAIFEMINLVLSNWLKKYHWRKLVFVLTNLVHFRMNYPEIGRLICKHFYFHVFQTYFSIFLDKNPNFIFFKLFDSVHSQPK